MTGPELVVIASPGRNVEWEIDVSPDVVADRTMLLHVVEEHLTTDTPIPGHYAISADRGHIGWFTIDPFGVYEWSSGPKPDPTSWAAAEQQAAEVQATRDARLAAGDPAEWERRLADRDANAPDDDMPALLESLRRSLAKAGGVPEAQVHVGHLPPRTASATDGNRRLRDLLTWIEATDARWGAGAARALLGRGLVDRLLRALRVPAHAAPREVETGRMDTSTLVGRLRSLADFLDGADFAVSWLYVDPTPDGPGEAETRHTIELDGQNAAEVTTNLDALTDTLAAVEGITAEAATDRVQIEALGTTTDGTKVRGLATYLQPVAARLMTAFAIDPATRTTLPLSLGDLEHLSAIVAEPTSPGGTPSTPAPTPSPTTDTDPSAPSSDSPVTPSEPSTPSGDAQPDPTVPAPADSTPPSADTSATGGGTTPAPDSGDAAGGLSTRGNSDAPADSSVTPSPAPSDGSPTPSPDPTSTVTTGTEASAPATGQQPGTPDGAPYNPDGTPVDPTAGTTADVGPDSSVTPSAPDPTNPGQTPVQIDETPVDSGASPSPSPSPSDSTAPATSDPNGTGSGSTTASSGPSGAGEVNTDRATQIANLRAQLAALEAQDAPVTDGGASAPAATEGNVDPVPEGGQNLASGQGGGPAGDPASSGGGVAYNPDGM